MAAAQLYRSETSEEASSRRKDWQQGLPRIVHECSLGLSQRPIWARPFEYAKGFWSIVGNKDLSFQEKFFETVDGVRVVSDAPRIFRCVLLAGAEIGRAPLLVSGIWKTLFACASNFVDLEDEENQALNDFIKSVSRQSQEDLYQGGVLFREAYLNILEIPQPGQRTRIHQKNPKEEACEQAFSKFVRFADSCCGSDDFLVSQVSSRGMYVLLAAIVTVTRGVFGIVGTLAAVGSFFWPHEKLVQVAHEGLGVLLIGRDLGFCAVKFVSPRANIEPACISLHVENYGERRESLISRGEGSKNLSNVSSWTSQDGSVMIKVGPQGLEQETFSAHSQDLNSSHSTSSSLSSTSATAYHSQVSSQSGQYSQYYPGFFPSNHQGLGLEDRSW